MCYCALYELAEIICMVETEVMHKALTNTMPYQYRGGRGGDGKRWRGGGGKGRALHPSPPSLLSAGQCAC